MKTWPQLGWKTDPAGAGSEGGTAACGHSVSVLVVLFPEEGLGQVVLPPPEVGLSPLQLLQLQC